MRSRNEIAKRVPWIKNYGLDMNATELTVGKQKGSVVFSFGVGSDWEHVSFAPYSGKMPTWDEMTAIKDIFFNEEEDCISIFPRKSEYVNLKENCLHIWRNKNIVLPL